MHAWQCHATPFLASRVEARRRSLLRVLTVVLGLVIGVLGATGPKPETLALPPVPAFGCWFWSEREFEADGYRPFLDLVDRHAAFDLLTTSLRVARREITDADTYDQVRRAAGYAGDRGMKLVMDLDVRLAREAFRRSHPDELQEMLRIREVPLAATGEVHLTITAEVPSDHYTYLATPYVPVASRLVRVFAFRRPAGGGAPEAVEDITARCRLAEAATNRVEIIIPGEVAAHGTHAAVLVAFAHLTPDVFAPHLLEFQRAILRQYAKVPLGGACKDEWGFPPCFDGNPAHDDYWFSRNHATAYARATRGRDLARDCLLMALGERGRERERQAAINQYQQLAWQRNAAIEADFYRAVKAVFGPRAVVATHPTWWPNPDLREFKKNGLDWWAVRRDIAQTDEATPFAVRTALSKKWNGSPWVNMFYSAQVADYPDAVWSAALGGGRLNFHPLYPSPHGLGLEITAGLLRGDLMRANARIRLLDSITHAPLDCPVAVVFGHAAAMNWAGPGFNDVGLALTDALWRAGQPADLLPSSEIASGALRVGPGGWVEYGAQRYSAVVLYHPEFEPEETARFVGEAARGPTAIWCLGEWTLNFAAQGFSPRLPRQLKRSPDAADCATQVLAHLQAGGIVPQAPATGTIGWDVKTAAPARSGFGRLTDGTQVWLAGANQVGGDPIELRQSVNGHALQANATGLFAVRFDLKGELAAFAAGGLRRFKCGVIELSLEPPLDVALWRSKGGEWQGIVQDCAGPVPPELLRLTTAWQRCVTPPPLTLP